VARRAAFTCLCRAWWHCRQNGIRWSSGASARVSRKARAARARLGR